MVATKPNKSLKLCRKLVPECHGIMIFHFRLAMGKIKCSELAKQQEGRVDQAA